MIDIGLGIAIAGVSISGGAVSIAAIRTFGNKNGNGNGNTAFPCKEHSGIVVGLAGLQKTADRQEKWLGEISKNVEVLLGRSK